ncbi:hypothetical protein IF1G_07847 [Cordyceps javanica]|uniref:C2 NT-type domain-containing protein n=1 Tax=Cordyceps javanica TaxID=43265 RepID=A0A545VUH2_9HYPO|nr:hypothetical protein IF1G_07847 [Cordyceps javanica]TQW05373.1 hypothetical protein IF2G_07310 [Cordyceps javanica]
MSSLIGKSRKPKFELHLKIYDLNNVPLVNGNSYIKWHLSHSMHAEHRGRTGKCPIANHKVDYDFSRIVPSIRISIDKNNMLSECPFELEVLQEFALTEKITLGHIKLNLSEFVEESEPYSRDVLSPPRIRKQSTGGSSISISSSNRRASSESRPAQEGIIRRYLMQDSKINSTLKIGILMVQIDGDRNFAAPSLRTAPVFGGIAGFMDPNQIEDETGPMPSFSKNRDNAEVQDLYRRTLAASWSKQPAQLPADECIEDIFSGGNGWKAPKMGSAKRDTSSSNTDPDDLENDDLGNNGTLRPSDFRRLGISNHRRHHSASSDRSVSTVTGGGHHRNSPSPRKSHTPLNSRQSSRLDEDHHAVRSSRSDSMASLVPTLGSSSGTENNGRAEMSYKHQREVGEDELRDNFVAWHLPGQEGLAA